MFAAIKVYNGTNKALFEDWIDELDQACRISGHDFRTQVIKKLTGVVCTVVMTSNVSPRPQPVWTQWIPEDLCSNQAPVLLERYEGASLAILQMLQGMCTTKG